MEEEKERNTKPGPTAAEVASLLTDDLVLEILSRLPARSVHRFKCVSVPWRHLIADPANRNKLPHALVGFFYTTYDYIIGRHCPRHFVNVSGDSAAPFDPSPPPSKYRAMIHVDACSGLLLYRRYDHKYNPDFAVCNPATGRWVQLPPLPPNPQAPKARHCHTAGLAFDPAVSSHFHVLYFELADSYMGTRTTGLDIYSSKTGAWSHRKGGTVEKVKQLFYATKCVFVGGMMYLWGNLYISNDYVLVEVDMEGTLWTTIRVPNPRRFATIGSSQGCLHYAISSVNDSNNILVSEISLWCLKDRDSKEFVLKHTASFDKLMSMTGQKYEVLGIHPDCDTIFLLSYGHDTLVSFDMQHQKVGRILNLDKDHAQHFLPYVPLFSEPLADADGQ